MEKWIELAKQEAGFRALEARTYKSLIRRWLYSRLAMYFLAAQTQRLRGEESADQAGAGRRCRQHAGVKDGVRPAYRAFGFDGDADVDLVDVGGGSSWRSPARRLTVVDAFKGFDEPIAQHVT